MFPKIDMKIREPAHDFLRRMKELIDEAGGFETRMTLEPPNDTHSSCLGFSPEKPSTHEGLVGLFVSWSDEYPLIRLQTIASRWQPDPPTHPVVCQAAAELYKPFIDAYNRKYKTRYRMRCDTPEETLPQLTPAARKAFDEFAGWANKRCLHPLDWQRFYYAHALVVNFEIKEFHRIRERVSDQIQARDFLNQAREYIRGFVEYRLAGSVDLSKYNLNSPKGVEMAAALNLEVMEAIGIDV